MSENILCSFREIHRNLITKRAILSREIIHFKLVINTQTTNAVSNGLKLQAKQWQTGAFSLQ